MFSLIFSPYASYAAGEGEPATFPETFEQWRSTLSTEDWLKVEKALNQGWVPYLGESENLVRQSMDELERLLSGESEEFEKNLSLNREKIEKIPLLLDALQNHIAAISGGVKTEFEVKNGAIEDAAESGMSRLGQLLEKGAVATSIPGLGRIELTFVNQTLIPVMIFEGDETSYIILPQGFDLSTEHFTRFTHRKLFLGGRRSRPDGKQGRDIVYFQVKGDWTEGLQTDDIQKITALKRPQAFDEKVISYIHSISGKMVKGDLITAGFIFAPFQILTIFALDALIHKLTPEKLPHFRSDSLHSWAPALTTGLVAFILTAKRSMIRNWEGMNENTRLIKNLSISILFYILLSVVRDAIITNSEYIFAGASSCLIGAALKMFMSLKSTVHSENRTMRSRVTRDLPFFGKTEFNLVNFYNDSKYTFILAPGKFLNQLHMQVALVLAILGSVTIDIGFWLNLSVASSMVLFERQQFKKHGHTEALTLYDHHLNMIFNPLSWGRSIMSGGKKLCSLLLQSKGKQ